MFTINFQTGITEIYKGTDLYIAMKTAEELACYTGLDILIHDNEGHEVARLPWYGYKLQEDDDYTIDFRELGFYGEWRLP